ncbi:MAG: S46 family peptidase [Bacteroidetes bacterium]|nr:S46 family peptidase [Bacteroidota bacterium]
MKCHFIRLMVLSFLLSPFSVLLANEGMWIPMLLSLLNEKEMQSMGLKLTAEDIYSINQSCLKDAIVIFGGGCTGEIISAEGLLLTNHHCGYGSIQRHSTLEKDYLTDGFWAASHDEELSNPGLTCTMLVRMEDVTAKVLSGVTGDLSEASRKKIIEENSLKISEAAVKGTPYEAEIIPFYYGNEFYMLIYEVFRDIRLVGAPPSNIGNFGGDTDNWMWPRHTGDFSIFRIYVNKDNQPAEYSPDNVPYTPKKHLTITLKGYERGDFTFVFGYPAFTQEYLPSYAIEMITFAENPIRIDLRTKSLNIILDAMRQNDLIRLQYASKHVGIANSWKKWMGEKRGIMLYDVVDKKRAYEDRFQLWVDGDPDRKAHYGELLPSLKTVYDQLTPYREAQAYYSEAGMRVEVLRFANTYKTLVTLSKEKLPDMKKISEETEKLKRGSEAFFKNYNADVDKKLFLSLFTSYMNVTDISYQPDVFEDIRVKYKGNITKYADELFCRSFFVCPVRLNALLDNYKPSHYKRLLKDQAYQLASGLSEYYLKSIQPYTRKMSITIDSLMRIYMKAQIEMEPDWRFYPDANSTLRVAYGKVDDYTPRDAVGYDYYTTLTGIMEKEDSTVYDYVVDKRLKELYINEDYGRYADKDGTMRVCFTASNHTTGGNSGSPVFNGDGYLIGINFDRNWEGTMSDLMYDPFHCRNICLDIRYCLFVIDKVAGASHLIDEMTIVE